MKKLLSTLVMCVALVSVSTAQDPNFSQFFTSPLTLNPALTGKFDGVYRIAINYRNQWPTINNAFTTSTISFDAGILKNQIPETDQFGIGIMGFTDKAGNGALRSEEHTSELQSHSDLVCRLLLEKKKKKKKN